MAGRGLKRFLEAVGFVLAEFEPKPSHGDPVRGQNCGLGTYDMSWYHGSMVPWYHGTMVPWYHGAMVAWYHGTMVPTHVICPKTTVLATNRVPVARFGLKLGQNESCGLQEPF